MRSKNHIPISTSDADLTVDHDAVNLVYNSDDQTFRFRDPEDRGNVLAFSATPNAGYWRAGAGFPKSGTSGTLVNIIPANGHYLDTETGVEFINKGSSASPYWEPVVWAGAGTNQLLVGVYDPFYGSFVTEALTDTDTSAILSGSGATFINIIGQGLTEIDSGTNTFPVTLNFASSYGEGTHQQFQTTDEDAHTIGLRAFNASGTGFQRPDVHGVIVVDAIFTNSGANTLRANFVGLANNCPNALDPLCTVSGTTITFAGSGTSADDVVGLFRSVEAPDAARWYFVSDKNNGGTQLTTATGVDTGVNIAAAGTFQQLRIEIWPDGTATAFINKVQVGSRANAVDTDQAMVPVIYLENVDSGVPTVISMLIRRFAFWSKRIAFGTTVGTG